MKYVDSGKKEKQDEDFVFVVRDSSCTDRLTFNVGV